MKDTKLQVRITKTEKEQLAAVAEKLDIPASQIVREAVRDRISDLNESVNRSTNNQHQEPALAA